MNYSKGEWKAFPAEKHSWQKEYRFAAIIRLGDLESSMEAYGATEEEANGNAHLIVTAVNACASINPDNPQAVAENIKAIYEALTAWDELRGMAPLDSGDDIAAIFEKCADIMDRVLSLVEGKYDGT